MILKDCDRNMIYNLVEHHISFCEDLATYF